jgi:hypothetical protein
LTFVLASEEELFIIADKARARGEVVKRRLCCERQRAKGAGWTSLAHTRWSGGRGYLRRVKWRGGERFVSGSGGHRHIFSDDHPNHEDWNLLAANTLDKL